MASSRCPECGSFNSSKENTGKVNIYRRHCNSCGHKWRTTHNL